MIIKNGKRLDGFCTDSLPIGTLQPYVGTTAPNGYLICDGSLVSKIIYPELYTICKSLFGTETSTHFYLPDLRGKTVAGYHAGDDTFNVLGLSLGEKKHLITQAESGVREHTHPMPLAHTAGVGSYGDVAVRAIQSSTDWEFRTGRITGLNTSLDRDYGSPALTGTPDANAIEAHNNIQPTIILNWIVKAKMLIPVTAQVENNLTSTSTTNALSAAQGKALNDKFNNYLTLSGTAKFAEALPGFIYGGTDQAWGNQVGECIYRANDVAGGSIAFRKDNPSPQQLSCIIDGYFYQGEGNYRCLDTRDLATSYAFYKWPDDDLILSANNTSISKELTITTRRGNPVLIMVSGDNNAGTDSSAKDWFNIFFYRNGTKLCQQICESHDLSHNIPFAMQYLDVVPAGTYTYKVEFQRGEGSSELAEDSRLQSPNFTVCEI